MVQCSVLGCKSNTTRKEENITFHRFPKESSLKRIWIEATGRPKFQPKKESCICSRHFEDKWFKCSENATVLDDVAVPESFKEKCSFSRNEKVMVINVYNYVRETWSSNEYPHQSNQYEQTAIMLGIDVASVSTILKEYVSNNMVLKEPMTAISEKSNEDDDTRSTISADEDCSSACCDDSDNITIVKHDPEEYLFNRTERSTISADEDCSSACCDDSDNITIVKHDPEEYLFNRTEVLKEPMTAISEKNNEDDDTRSTISADEDCSSACCDDSDNITIVKHDPEEYLFNRTECDNSGAGAKRGSIACDVYCSNKRQRRESFTQPTVDCNLVMNIKTEKIDGDIITDVHKAETDKKAEISDHEFTPVVPKVEIKTEFQDNVIKVERRDSWDH